VIGNFTLVSQQDGQGTALHSGEPDVVMPQVEATVRRCLRYALRHNLWEAGNMALVNPEVVNCLCLPLAMTPSLLLPAAGQHEATPLLERHA
jgi:hypothetical protein